MWNTSPNSHVILAFYCICYKIYRKSFFLLYKIPYAWAHTQLNLLHIPKNVSTNRICILLDYLILLVNLCSNILVSSGRNYLTCNEKQHYSHNWKHKILLHYNTGNDIHNIHVSLYYPWGLCVSDIPHTNKFEIKDQI